MLLGFNTFTAQAALLDRGNGMLYDDVLNVTWLQDANYAKTSSYDSDGRMDWTSAKTWADTLDYGGYSDWRLASNSPVNGSSFNHNVSYNGISDIGYNITSTHSELSYMYYVNLGLKGYYSPNHNYQPDYGIFGNGTTNGTDQSSFGQTNVGLVKNLQSYIYWSGTEVNGSEAWLFNTINGTQGYRDMADQFHAWAVRDGDVAAQVSAVPVPAAVWLFGSGLVGLLGLKRRSNRA